jgi:hypothetical protein
MGIEGFETRETRFTRQILVPVKTTYTIAINATVQNVEATFSGPLSGSGGVSGVLGEEFTFVFTSTQDIRVGDFISFSAGMSAEIISSPTIEVIPILRKITPNSGLLAGGIEITITGNNFVGGATVEIGGTQARVTAVDGTQITAIVPGGGEGGYADVVVTNPDGRQVSESDGFAYTTDPLVTAIRPPFSLVDGGNEVVISGENFIEGLKIYIGGRRARVISVISPSSGPLKGGTEVKITGENFADNATVSFGGEKLTDVKVISATEIVIITPPMDASAIDIFVRNPHGALVATEFLRS